MNLYKIEFAHYAPKDREDGIKGYVLAKNDEEMYHYIDKQYCYDSMEDENEETEDDYDPEFDEFETYKARMIHLKGRMNDEEYDIADTYYGVTVHGWELVEENVKVEDFAKVIELNIIKQI